MEGRKRLAIITTHPIQYNAPLFQLLQKRGNIELKAFYTWGVPENSFDKGFGKEVVWDIPLTSGYEFEFLEPKNKKKHSFFSIKCPFLLEKVDEYNPSAILVFGWNYYSHLYVIKHYKGRIPVYFRGDSTLLDEGKAGLKKMLRRLFLKWVYSGIGKALFVGESNREYYLKHGVSDSQLVFAPHAIDNDRFSSDEHLPDESMQIWRNHGIQIKETEVVFLFVGKFEPKKNPTLLVQAFLLSNMPNSHLVLIGNGVLETQLKAMAENNLNIHFIDFQNQKALPALYAAADVLVLPSKGPGETWGLVVNEAMACGKAIIVSDKVGCAKNLVQENVNGAVFENDNVNDLCAALVRMNNKKQAIEMGRHSKEIISAYSYAHICEVIEGLMT